MFIIIRVKFILTGQGLEVRQQLQEMPRKTITHNERCWRILWRKKSFKSIWEPKSQLFQLIRSIHFRWACFSSMTWTKKQKLGAGVLVIDIFTRYLAVVPIRSKGKEIFPGVMIEALKRKHGKPKLLYTNDLTTLNTQAIQDCLKKGA